MSLTGETEPGAYTVSGTDGGTVTGCCAGCYGDVTAADAYVLRYHPTKRGGIFHRACEPKGEGWYGIDDT